MPLDDRPAPSAEPPPGHHRRRTAASIRRGAAAAATVLALVLTGCASSPEPSQPSGAPTAGAPTGSEPAGGGDLASRGEELFQAQTCANCHSVDGSTGVGPSLAGIWGEEVALEDGSTATVDAAYVAESLRDPNAKVVEGFAGIMPSYDELGDEDVAALVAYIESLGEAD